jgi:hypothetical protein
VTHLQPIGGASPVVQIPPVGGPPRRSADKTPEPPPVVRTKNLQVASSTRGRKARKKYVVQVLVTVKRVRNFRFYIRRSLMTTRRACPTRRVAVDSGVLRSPAHRAWCLVQPPRRETWRAGGAACRSQFGTILSTPTCCAY